MKKIRFLILFGLLLCTVSIFGACNSNKNPLSTPVNLQIDSDTLMLTWRESTDALRYQVEVGGSVKDTRKNSYSLRSLPEGEYTVRVRAIAKSNSSKSNSAWSAPISFSREHEPGMVFTLTTDKKAYELTSLGTAKGDVEIPATYRGKPVVSIGKRAFISKVDLTGCVIGPNVTSIGEQAFSRSSLASVTFPDGLTQIGARAFEGCKELTGTLTLPDSLTSLGASAFNDCEKLEGIVLGKGLQVLNENSFSDCDALSSITFTDSLLAIGPKAFANCRALQSVNIGNKVQAIYDAAFYMCPNLSSVTLNDELLYVGAEAFARCNKLASITVPDSVQYIGDRCFCTYPISLNRNDYDSDAAYNTAVAEAVLALPLAADKITLGTGLQQVGRDAFTYTQAWYTAGNVVTIGGWIVGVKDTDKVVGQITPADGTRGIADYAYAECKATAFLLPDSVQYVGTGAFFKCTALAGGALGKGVKELGAGAFYGCESLANVFLGERNGAGQLGVSSLEQIGSQAFSGCTRLGNVTIPLSVTGIGYNAFEDTQLFAEATDAVAYAGDSRGARWVVGYKGGLQYFGQVYVEVGTVGIADYVFYGEMVSLVELPVTVKYIGRAVFYKSWVRKVTLPEGITEIGDYAFYDCGYLQDVNIPSTVKYIGRSAFHQTSLSSLTIPAAVEEIGDYAFYGNDSLASLTFANGSNLKKIGSYAFYGCELIPSLDLPDSLQTMGEYAFKKCASLTSLRIGGNLTVVPKQAFAECEELISVTIAPGVQKIGDYAFYKNANLKNLSLGTVSEIGNYAFYGCAALRTLTFPSSVTIGKQAFRNCSGLASVVVSNGTTIADHAFYGTGVTYYIEADAPGETWGTRWNSAYRAAVYGVTLSADKTYLESIRTGENITGVNEKVLLTSPVRSGYVFDGWATVPGGDAEYELDEIAALPAGTTLYAVWVPVD